MTRSGLMGETPKERMILHVECESVELFIVGASSKMQDIFEGYAIASLPVPIEIDKVKKVEKVLFEKEFYKVVEVFFDKTK